MAQQQRSITDEMRALQQELAQIEVRVTSREADVIDRLRTDLDIARGEIAKARREAAAADAARQKAEEDAEELRVQLEEQRITIASKDKIIDTVEQGCTALRTEFAKVQQGHAEELQKLREEVKCRDEMLAVLREQLESLRSQVELAEHERDAAGPSAVRTDEAPEALTKAALAERDTPRAASEAVRAWDTSVPGPSQSPNRPQRSRSTPASHVSRGADAASHLLDSLWNQLDVISAVSTATRRSKPSQKNTAPRGRGHAATSRSATGLRPRDVNRARSGVKPARSVQGTVRRIPIQRPPWQD